jgi:hypothetical protein
MPKSKEIPKTALNFPHDLFFHLLIFYHKNPSHIQIKIHYPANLHDGTAEQKLPFRLEWKR